MNRFWLGTFIAWCLTTNSWGADPTLDTRFIPAGHSAAIVWASWSPDGSRIATAAEDEQILIWDAKTGSILQRLHKENQGFGKPTWSGDGKRLMCASHATYPARVWDVASGKLIRRLPGNIGASGDGQLSSDGAKALLPSPSGQLGIWDVETGELSLIGGKSSLRIYSCLMDASETIGFGSCVENGEFVQCVLEVKTGKILHKMPLGKRIDSEAAITGDGTLGATGDSGGQVVLWDLKDGSQKHVLKGHAGAVDNVSFSHDGSVLASTDISTTILWDTRSGEKLAAVKIESSRRGELHGQGKLLAATGAPGVTIWDLMAGKVERVLKPAVSPLQGLAMDASGKRLYVGAHDGTVVVWDMDQGKPLKSWLAHEAGITRISCDANGDRLATGSARQHPTLWNPQTGEKIREFPLQFSGVKAMALHPQGTQLLVNSGQGDALSFDCASGESRRMGGSGWIQSMGWSPNGDRCWIGSSHDDRAVVIDSQTTQPIHDFVSRTAAVMSGGISPEGRTLATGHGGFSLGHAIVWDLESGKPARTLVGHRKAVQALCYRPQGGQIVTACGAGEARVWSLEDGKKLAELLGHGLAITGVVWHPEDRWIATSSLDGTVRLWEPKSGREFCRLVAVDGGKDWIISTPDGRFQATGDALQRINLHQSERFLKVATPDLWRSLFPQS
ncbi:MAG: PQQ-binding-like beta-propeller repeat protein [Pirellulales bacterium]